MGSSKKQTVGYRYFMGLHFAICQGPVDALLQINAGDRNAWDGTVRTSPIRVKWAMLEVELNVPIPESGGGPVTESKAIRIVAPELFGGDKKEGGIMGWADVMMGEEAQQPNAYLVSQLGNPMPAFRGILSLVFRKGLVGSMNPYPKPWAFKVRRIHKGWRGAGEWYPEKAAIPVSGEAGSGGEFIGMQAHYGGIGPGNLQIASGTSEVWPGSSEAMISSRMIFKILPPDPSLTANPRNYPRRAVVTELATGRAVADTGWVGDAEMQVGLNYVLMDAGRLDLAGDYFAVIEREVHVSLPFVPGALKFDLYTARPADAPEGGFTTVVNVYTGINPSTEVIAMNPAHIVYQALTDTDWGMGYPPAAIDAASFQSAADTFHFEGIGLCGQWTRQDTIESFVQEILSHAGAALGQDPRTGLFRLIPTRGDYAVEDLPEFRRGLNVSAVDSFERAALGEVVNEVTVQYVDARTGNDGAVTVQHLANVQAQGGVVSQSVRYPMAPTASIAQRLAQRDLTTKASPLCKVKLTTDRSAFGLLPGDVVRWTDAKLGIADMPMRVLQVDYGSLTAGAIKMDLAEDVFGMPATTYLGQQEGGWVEPSTEPQPPAAAQAFEIPYLAIHRAEGGSVANALAQDAGYLGMLAAKAPGVSYGYTLMASVAGGEFEQVGGGEWAASAILAADIGPADTVLPLGGVTDSEEFAVGALVMIGGGHDAELVRIDSATPGAASITVGRGVGDTVAGPAGWPIGTRVWVVDDNVGEGVTEYVEGETVEARASTNAPGGTLPLGASPGGTVAMAARAARPYPPAGLTVGGVAWPVQGIGEIELEWAHRDRLLQADQLVDQAAGSIGPETGTTYTVRTYVDDVLDDEQAGITGTAATVLPSGNGVARVEVVAVRDGLESWQAQVREFQYRVSPYLPYTDQDGTTYADQDGQTYEG